jgi:tRNA (mo5U34)-methyltransferase
MSKRGTDFSGSLEALGGWYHSFALPDGSHIEGYNSLEHLRYRYGRFPIPSDLAGRTVLDIGAWDGWFTFEAERRGAQVTALDCVEIENFLEMRKRLGSRAEYKILDFYDLPTSGLARFDYTFFLGVLYHLKHPLLALEIVCALTKEVAIVDSFVIDGHDASENAGRIPWMEFYELDELGNQLDNWIGPTLECLMAMCRSAGFARVELLDIEHGHAALACYRRWEPEAANPHAAAPVMITAAHARNYGRNFHSRGDEYVACWFQAGARMVRRPELRMEIGGFGVPCLHVHEEVTGRWMANFRLPPGLASGWHEARLRFHDSGFSAMAQIAVDMAPHTDGLTLRAVYDGHAWTEGKLKRGGIVSFWILGLSDNCDRNNIRVLLGGRRQPVDYVGGPEHDHYRQINANVKPDQPLGEQDFVVEFAGMAAAPLRVQVSE